MRRLFTAWWFVPALALAGCSTGPKLLPTPPAPVIAKVAVPVPCAIAKPDKPDRPKKLAQKDDSIWTAARLIVADHMVQDAYIIQLEAAMSDPCPGPKE